MSAGLLEFNLSEKEWLELVRESKRVEEEEEYRKYGSSTNSKRKER